VSGRSGTILKINHVCTPQRKSHQDRLGNRGRGERARRRADEAGMGSLDSKAVPKNSDSILFQVVADRERNVSPLKCA
jgi:hypothetical protein